MNNIDLTHGVEQAWTNFITFLPKLAIAVGILIVGYFVAKLFTQLLDRVLTRTGFDRMVERGGIKRVLSKTQYHASNLLGKIVFYTILLFVLELAFGIFGPNPISDLLTSVISFLPSLFVALIIIVVASAIGSAVKDILQATLAGLSYGRLLANLAAIAIIATGIFAALNQIHIAPAIVNGLFYALLAAGAGSAIVAIGGGGIMPMRAQWEKWLGRIEQEAPRLRERLAQRSTAPGDVKEQAKASRSGEQKSFPQ
jgi:hypothetical protein